MIDEELEEHGACEVQSDWDSDEDDEDGDEHDELYGQEAYDVDLYDQGAYDDMIYAAIMDPGFAMADDEDLD